MTIAANNKGALKAHYRFLGKPDQGMQELLMEQLEKDPNWY